MLESITVRLFDFLKRKDMEKEYLREDIWGRSRGAYDIDAAVALVSDRQYEHCLDVGTGLGHYAERLAPICTKILAIDISERAVRRTRARLQHLSNITFKRANIRELHTREMFDLIVLGDVLYYLGDVRFPKEFHAVLGDIANRVSPSGRILISNYISVSRTEEQLRSYIELFKEHGLIVEKSTIFSNDGKSWLQTVLKREP